MLSPASGDRLDPSCLTGPRARPRVSREREARQTVGGGWGLAASLTWRYRQELAPFALALGLLAVPAAGHLADEGLAWAPALAGSLLAGWVVLAGHRPIHRWQAAAAGAAGLWTAAAWWVGLGDPIVLGGYVALVGIAAAVWLRYARPRTRVRVRGGSAWPWQYDRWQFGRVARREAKRAMATWEVASFWGRVPRSSIRAADADIDEDHILLTVELVPGHIVIDLDNRRAASAIGAPVAHVVVLDEGAADVPANIVQVRWYWAGLEVAEEAQEAVADAAPEPEDLAAVRLERLRAAVERIGAREASGRELARLAGLPHDWVNRHLAELAPLLGVRRVGRRWRRLAVAGERTA